MTDTPDSASRTQVSQETLERIVEVRMQGTDEPIGIGVLVNSRTVLTTASALAGDERFDVVAGQETHAARRGSTTRALAGVGLAFLELDRPVPIVSPVQIGDAALGDYVLVVFSAGSSWEVRLAQIAAEEPDRWLLDDVSPEGLVLSGVPVFRDDTIVGMVTAVLATGGLEVARLAGIASDLREFGSNELDNDEAAADISFPADGSSPEAPAVSSASRPESPTAGPDRTDDGTRETPSPDTPQSSPAETEPAPVGENASTVDLYESEEPSDGHLEFTDATKAVFRWYEVVFDGNADTTTPYQALLAAFVLFAASNTHTVASIAREHLRGLQRTRRKADSAVLSALGVETPPAEPVDVSGGGRDELSPIVLTAADIRDRTEPGGPIHLRHVLVSTIAHCPDDLRLSLDIPKLSQSTLAVLSRDAPDLLEQWLAVFASLESIVDPLPGVSAVSARGRRMAGMTLDAVDASTRLNDELQVERDVNTLCDVLAAVDVSPPISVGLFGEWGSGKSYFMAMMRRRLRALAELSAKEKAQHRPSAYCSDIQFIEFNAWHYVDSNLWASLAVRLFEGMVNPGDGPLPGERAAALRAEIQQRESQLETVDRKVAKALADPRLEAAARELGAESSRTATLSLASETWKTVMFAKAIWQRLFTSKSKRGRWFFVLGSLGVTALAAYGVYLVTADDASLIALLSGIPAAFTIVRFFSRIVPKVTDALKQINLVLEASSLKPGDVTKERLEKDPKLLELRVELKKVEAEDSFATHLLERANSEEYRRHFGLIAIVRKDLEELEKQLRTSSSQRRIVLFIDDLDRCPPARVVEVLQAVHLLLAFPLFVAVVGVDPRWLMRSLRRHYRQILSTDHEIAEDKHDELLTDTSPHDYLEKIFQIPFSLDQISTTGYRTLVDSLVSAPSRDGESDPSGGAASAVASGDMGSVLTTPDDGVLRTGSSHTPNERTSGARSDDHESSPPTGRASGSGNRSGSWTTNVTAQQQVTGRTGTQHDESTNAGTPTDTRSVAAEAAEIDPNPERLNVSEGEKAALYALGPMVSTPRSTKRLVNIYRLIKARLPDDKVTPFVEDGSYEAVAVLLGCLVGFPIESRALFAFIAEQDQTTNSRMPAKKFVEAFKVRMGSQQDEVATLIAAVESVLEERPTASQRTLADYAIWIRDVQRYSFDGAISAAYELPPPPPKSPKRPKSTPQTTPPQLTHSSTGGSSPN